MHGAHLHKTSWRDAMAQDLRRDLLGWDQDILLRDRAETWDASVRDRDETETLRILSEMRPRRDVSTSLDRLETKTSRPRPHPWKSLKPKKCTPTLHKHNEYLIYIDLRAALIWFVQQKVLRLQLHDPKVHDMLFKKIK